MNDQIKLLIGMVVVIVIPALLAWFIFHQQEKEDDTSQPDSKSEILWGVDSATQADQDMYQCVNSNYGTPAVWGRYLGDIENVSDALTKDEAAFLHEKDVQILVIYNLIEDATGYENGAAHAESAIDAANELDIPEGVALFADIEPIFPVDTAFLESWYDTLKNSAYEPGVYGVFDEGSDILSSYNEMEPSRQQDTVVWTAFPQQDITTKENAPDYAAQGPDQAKVYGWQYAIDGETCTIDTNLFKPEMRRYLW
ncbi:hypothetical protein JNUCC1_02766 [Lentibacillus sp. JNUCC-1]|uniref:glycoside hydrolase domain-containing protein n=1 Tax=Lentibacillus sp. JNUCC-1 TaxID=2654513 RepID=UPI0012E90B57|nr:glycoside hydrolase domain-containing protein [Lentibacillus sp. JNUCC-1]MUV38894.1 hypothetical protein [Lentibacillus sp. JNUCC-1]